MQYGEKTTLYRKDGTEIIAEAFFMNPDIKLADGLVTEDDRVIWCKDEELGIFWFQDTQEELYLNRQPSTHS